MSAAVVYLLSHAALLGFGAFAAFHPSVRDLSVTARAAAAFGAGAVVLALEATLWSILGIPWSAAVLSLPLLLLTGLSSWRLRARATGRSASPSFSPSAAVAVSGVAIAAGLAHLSLSLATSRSTSADFLFFWGVKAVRFVEAKGFFVALLDWAYFAHAVPDYPPLVPVVQAWGVLAAGEMPWRRAPLAAVVWLAAALPLLLALLRRRLSGDAAAAVTAFWGVALAVSLAHSYSGGNAEAPLLFYVSVAAGALLAERDEGPSPSRFLPALFLAGAALTKVEAVPAVGLLALGTVARDFLDRRPRSVRRALPLLLWPALALASWFCFQAVSGLRVGYRGHGSFFALTGEHAATIVRESARQLSAGTGWLSWILPLLFLAASPRRWRTALPGLLFSAGLLLFFLFDYLHDRFDPALRIEWTLPRISQPALSVLILAAGVSFFSKGRGGRLGPDPGPEPEG